MSEKKNEILSEITPLSTNDCIYVVERRKTEFEFPLHKHAEYELNYVENAQGASRIVGDSIEEISDYDLVLITNPKLEHAWKNGNCKSNNIKEITIQFSPKLLKKGLLNKELFNDIREMFCKAEKGIAFSLADIVKVRPFLNSLTNKSEGFYSFVNFLSLLHELSQSKYMKVLASSSFAQVDQITKSRRIKKIIDFMSVNYNRKITLEEVADLISMTPSSFSKFFKTHTNKNFTDFLNDFRIGKASRLLVNSNQSIAEICFECGFNNISNFNRIFLKKKNITPKEFRQLYQKNQIIL